MKIVGYARYSDDKQRDASIEDQRREYRAWATRQQHEIVGEYADRAITGAIKDRPQFQAMLRQVKIGGVDAVVAESLDRFSRDLEHTAAFFKQLTFWGVKILTLNEGEVTPLHVGLRGTMSQMYLTDLADKTRRGLRGIAESGKHAGGDCYGYRVGPDGKLAVHDPEAQIVRRIFERYAQGQSSRAIAHALNRDKIAGPRGGQWSPSTIHGNPKRGVGILNNELYVGRQIWNRLRYVKDPQTGKRVSRLNAESEWTITAQPDLRIISDGLWQTVKARQAASRIATPRKAHGRFTGYVARAQHLFSGLLRCGVCGGAFSTSSGRQRCFNHHERGTCSNSLTISRHEVEQRVLNALQDSKLLVSDELVEEFYAEYVRETNRLRGEARADLIAAERELVTLDAKRKKLVALVMDGVPGSEVKDELLAIVARREELQQQVALLSDLKPLILHPNMATLYREYVIEARAALHDESGQEAVAALRKIVDAIILTPGPDGRLAIQVQGELARMLAAAVPEKTEELRRVSVVAGAHNRRCAAA